jgi:hypothetical protein
MRIKRSSMRVALLVFLIAATVGCVVTPTDGQNVSPFSPISFNGFAQRAGATLRVESYNKRFARWDTVATFTASTSATTISGDTLYRWSGSLQFSTLPQWECYWSTRGSSTCSIPPGSASAQLRVQEVGAGTLTTFDSEGVSCVGAKLDAGKSWLVAGYECRDDTSPIIALSWIT